MKHRILSALALAAVSAALGTATASADTATVTPYTIDGGGQTGAACVDGNGSICLYYSANGTGARVQTFNNISCYDNCGGSNYYFDDTTAGSAGLGDIVRNATHYAYNNDTNACYAIYVSPNYTGNSDWLYDDGAPQAWSAGVWQNPYYKNLGYTQNNNASQEIWTNC